MSRPWIFREVKHYLASGEMLPPPSLAERWEFILHHCRRLVASGHHGDERHAMMAMRSRLVAYCKGFPGARELRPRLTKVSSVAEVAEIAAECVAGTGATRGTHPIS